MGSGQQQPVGGARITESFADGRIMIARPAEMPVWRDRYYGEAAGEGLREGAGPAQGANGR